LSARRASRSLCFVSHFYMAQGGLLTATPGSPLSSIRQDRSARRRDIIPGMLKEAPALRKALFVALVVCAVVSAQAFSLTAEYHHHQSIKDCCWLCHLGPFLFLQPVAASAAGPWLHVAWLERCGDLGAPHDPQTVARSSRAPPA
jgi:hypothetical protein